MSNPVTTPYFMIHRMYVKDLALHQPNSPGILLETTAPKVDVSFGFSANGVQDGIFEVCVVATVHATITDKTLFQVEVNQSGIFEIRNLTEEQLEATIGIACPQMIFPYLRSTVSDVCTRGGFPPVVLAEVDFRAMFESRKSNAGQPSPQPAKV